MDNLIVALVKGEPLLTEDISVVKPEEASLEAMNAVVARAKALKVIVDESSLRKASLAAQELQGLRLGLKANYDRAKAPINSTGRAIDQIFHDLDGPLEAEYKRLDVLVSTYHAAKKREIELAERRKEAERRAAEERAKAKIRELEQEKERLALRLRMAEEAAEKRKADRELKRAEIDIEAAKIAAQVEQETIMPDEPAPTPRVPGGRPWVQYICEITDVALLFKDHPELVKWALRQAAAQALAKSLDESGKPLVVPGLSIRKLDRTSFPGATAIRVHGEQE